MVQPDLQSELKKKTQGIKNMHKLYIPFSDTERPNTLDVKSVR